MPCFEGLFPPSCDGAIQDVLFVMATWHGFAKLRMHTDMSLRVFEGLTTILGKVMRYFANHVCTKLPAYATPKEAAAKARQKAKTQKNKQKERPTDSGNESHDRKFFNLFTYKWHVLTHYVPIIQRYGTLDLLSCQKV